MEDNKTERYFKVNFYYIDLNDSWKTPGVESFCVAASDGEDAIRAVVLLLKEIRSSFTITFISLVTEIGRDEYLLELKNRIEAKRKQDQSERWNQKLREIVGGEGPKRPILPNIQIAEDVGWWKFWKK